MTIIVKDEEGLGNALMMDGYTDPQICGAYDAIRDQFREAAVLVFSEIMGEPLPDRMIVNTAPGFREDPETARIAALASFNSILSRAGILVFNVHEDTIKGYLTGDEGEIGQFRATVVHEMMHAADLPELTRRNHTLQVINKKIDQLVDHDSFGKHDEYPQIALFNLMNMLGHNRAEGIALLGEHILTAQEFAHYSDAPLIFERAFELTMLNADKWLSHIKANDPPTQKLVWRMAYHSAPIILLKVLSVRGDIDEPVLGRVLEGFQTGVYDLSDEEVKRVLKAALSLNMQDFIGGLLQLGDDVAPIWPVLRFCAQLQGDLNQANILHFIRMVRSPESVETFNQAMDVIMGVTIPEPELDEMYSDFMQSTSDTGENAELKERVMRLYSVMKTTADSEKKSIAMWALTYFFDDQDLIHDDIPGLGLVDDMLVMDQALRVLSEK